MVVFKSFVSSSAPPNFRFGKNLDEAKRNRLSYVRQNFPQKIWFSFLWSDKRSFFFQLGDNLLFRGGWSGVSEFALIEINTY